MSSGDFSGGSASFLFTGDDKDFQRVADAVEKRMGKVATSFDFSPVQAQFKQVGDEIERTSERVVRFGLRLGILGRISSGLGQMGRAAQEMSAKFRLGEESAGALFEKLAGDIPVIGGFIQFGRGLREIITGENSYTQVVLAQAKAQDDRREAVERYLTVQKQLVRQTEDLTKNLTGKPGVVSDITGFFTGGAREAEDLKSKTQERFNKQFDDIAEERKRLGEKLRALEESNHPTAVSAGEGGASFLPVDPGIPKAIEAAQRSLKVLDDQAARLRGQIEQFEELTREKIGRTVVTEILQKLGGEFTKGFQTAGVAIDGYLRKIDRLSSDTTKALDAITPKQSGFSQLLDTLLRFQSELGRGLINPDQFRALSFTAVFDFAGKQADAVKTKIEGWLAPLDAFGAKMSAGFQSALTAQDTLRDVQIAQLQASAALGDRDAKIAIDRLEAEKKVFELRKRLQADINDPNVDAATRKRLQDTRDSLPDIQSLILQAAGKTTARPAEFLGLDQLGRKIQQSAFGSDPAIKIAQDQLEALKLLGRGGARSEAELKKINDNLKNVGTVK